jgi:hypothetical protein
MTTFDKLKKPIEVGDRVVTANNGHLMIGHIARFNIASSFRLVTVRISDASSLTKNRCNLIKILSDEQV